MYFLWLPILLEKWNEIEIKVNHFNVVIKMAFKTAYEQYTDHNSAADMIEIYTV